MKAWRIVLRKFGRTSRAAFGGLSGFSVDGRWHTAGRHLDYTAQSLSLAILERLVHYKRFDVLEPHVVYGLDVPDAAIESVPAAPDGWDGEEPASAAQTVIGPGVMILVTSTVVGFESLKRSHLKILVRGMRLMSG